MYLNIKYEPRTEQTSQNVRDAGQSVALTLVIKEEVRTSICCVPAGD